MAAAQMAKALAAFSVAAMSIPAALAAEAMGETVVPKALGVRARLRLLVAPLRALFIPILGRIEIAGIDAHARGFVGHLALLIERILRLGGFAGHPIRDHLLLKFHCGFAVAVEGIRHRHRALRRRLRRRVGRGVDALLENHARILGRADGVEHVGRGARRGVLRQLAVHRGARLGELPLAREIGGLTQVGRLLFAFRLLGE